MGPARRVLCTQWVTEFLQFILNYDSNSTILVVCATKESFLELLLATVNVQSAKAPIHHPLLTKTIGLFSKSTKIKTVFCPTLEHLRAYLSAGITEGTVRAEKNCPSPALVAILNPISLHLSTLEFSAQGLSRTLANSVETASREGVDLILCECRNATNLNDSQSGEALWYMDVPLLNSPVPMTGPSQSSLVVTVRRVAQRWFEFMQSSPDSGFMDVDTPL